MEENKQNMDNQKAVDRMIAYLQENKKEVAAAISKKGGSITFEAKNSKLYVKLAKSL